MIRGWSTRWLANRVDMGVERDRTRSRTSRIDGAVGVLSTEWSERDDSRTACFVQTIGKGVSLRRVCQWGDNLPSAQSQIGIFTATPLIATSGEHYCLQCPCPLTLHDGLCFFNDLFHHIRWDLLQWDHIIMGYVAPKIVWKWLEWAIELHKLPCPRHLSLAFGASGFHIIHGDLDVNLLIHDQVEGAFKLLHPFRWNMHDWKNPLTAAAASTMAPLWPWSSEPSFGTAIWE